jgi:hypothetical protein
VASGPNLFGRLHKWAARQDENFLTESLAVLLEHLLLLAPAVGTRLVKQVTGGLIDLSNPNPNAIDIRTQVTAEDGRPDLELATPNCLVWIEVKVESEVRKEQLDKYLRELETKKGQQTRLVLLTRYPETSVCDGAGPIFKLRWCEVAALLEQELSAAQTGSEAARFVAGQFLDFLRGRGMTTEKVTYHMPEGIKALSNLLNMLSEAGAACKVDSRKAADSESIGLNLDHGKYRVSVGYADPGKLWFGTRCRIDPQACRRLGLEAELYEERVPGGYRWWREVELDSEEVYFFCRSKVSQMMWLEKFLRECLAMAHKIESPEQLPIPDEPEGT